MFLLWRTFAAGHSFAGPHSHTCCWCCALIFCCCFAALLLLVCCWFAPRLLLVCCCCRWLLYWWFAFAATATPPTSLSPSPLLSRVMSSPQDLPHIDTCIQKYITVCVYTWACSLISPINSGPSPEPPLINKHCCPNGENYAICFLLMQSMCKEVVWIMIAVSNEVQDVIGFFFRKTPLDCRTMSSFASN